MAALAQGERRGDARAGQADDQEGTGRQSRTGRANGQGAPIQMLSDCWYSVNPIALQTAATIQKRRMIFVSDQACSSKW